MVTFNNGEEETSIISGFTITNGNGQRGGGIFIDGASPHLEHLIVERNLAAYGGGAMVTGEASPTFEHVSFIENTATGYGGAIYCASSNIRLWEVTIVGDPENLLVYGGGIMINRGEATLENVTITRCRASYGGGLAIFSSENTILDHVLVYDNIGTYGGGFYLSGSNVLADHLTVTGNTIVQNTASAIYSANSEIELTNSIFWADGGEDSTVLFFSRGTVLIDYCDIENGQDDIINQGADLVWGDSIIDDDPLWVDPDEGDYQLAGNSPCINTGDPDAAPDPDSSRTDIGAFSYFHSSLLNGYVSDSLTDEPVEDVFVSATTGQSTLSDTAGYWVLEFMPIGIEFDVTASIDLLLDSIAADLSLEPEDTLDVIFNLLHPLFELDTTEVTLEVELDSIRESRITLSNQGNYRMLWSANRHSVGNEGPWSLMRSYDFGRVVQDERIEGVVFLYDRFYVAGGNGEEQNLIYVFNANGELEETFEQPSNARSGIYDLAWDGELLWGGDNTRDIYGFTTDGELVFNWDGPNRTNQALAWDSDNEALWIAGISSSEIVAYSREGIPLMSVSQFDFLTLGLGYWADDPDGYPLYVMHSPDLESTVIHKIDIENEDTLYVATLAQEQGGSSLGAFISLEYVTAQAVFMTVANDADDDRVDLWLIDDDTSWLTFNPEDGELGVDEEDVLIISLLAAFEVGRYEAGIEIEFTEVGGGIDIPITMDVFTGPRPPYTFNLLRPTLDDTISSPEVTFSWVRAIDPNPEDNIRYNFWIRLDEESAVTEINETRFVGRLDTLGIEMQNDVQVEWWVTAISNEDTTECAERFTFYTTGLGAEDEAEVPVQFALHNVYPNPFNSATSVRYSLPIPTDITLAVFDQLGRKVITLVEGRKQSGVHTTTFSARDLPSGLYFIRLQAAEKDAIRKVMLIR